jgi:hypothetical protein
VDFEYSIDIERPPEVCFAFLRDKHTYPQKPGSPVLVLDKITSGPIEVGTRYVEVVQMFPLVKGTIYSVITHFEPPHHLAEDFEGAGMWGQLAYEFVPNNKGTRLTQREWVQYQGLWRIFEPLLKQMLAAQLWKRLQDIKKILEEGWEERIGEV